jgi:Leucine-rich repeat (LRR) protein
MNLKKLPAAIKELHALHFLNVKDNLIEELDDDFFAKLTHLRYFNISGNKLKVVPSSFKFCRRIKDINFSSNELTDFP